MYMRAVLDTSVVVAALRSRRGPANKILFRVARREMIPLGTPSVFLEYEEVLKRPEQRLAHGLTLVQVDDFLAELAALMEPVEVRYQWRPQLRDPGDEMILEAAINGHADVLVTYNVRDFAGVERMFGIRVMTPVELVGRQEL
jgi:putative PIN family toxin of toxin-antitoxin system